MLANNTAKNTDTMIDPFSAVSFRIVKENTPPDKLTPSQREILKAISDTIASFREDRIKGVLSPDEVATGSAPLDLAQFGMPKDKSIAPSEPFSESEAA